MFDQTINGVEYTNIVYKDKEFIIQKTGSNRKGKYNNKFKLTNTRGGVDYHSHLNNIKVCKKLIDFTREKKLLLTAKKYLIISCSRITTDPKYKQECIDLYNRKKNKGKQAYYNKNQISR